MEDYVDERTRKYREILDQLIVEVKESTIEEHDEPFRAWFKKNQVILDDIESLRKSKNNTSKISAFLLESQYIEFKIIELLQRLEILINSDPNIIKFVGKRRNKELYEFTLGQLHVELNKYEAKFLKKFVKLVKKLNEIRIRFAHYLFTSIKGIEDIVVEAKTGLEHNDKIIKELYLIHKYIDKETWYGQMYEKKKVKEFTNKGRA